LSGTLIVVVPLATLMTPVDRVLLPALVKLIDPAPLREYPSAMKLMLLAVIAPGTVIVPIPVLPKIAPSPLALFQIAGFVQLPSVVFQVKLLAALVHVLSPARDG